MRYKVRSFLGQAICSAGSLVFLCNAVAQTISDEKDAKIEPKRLASVPATPPKEEPGVQKVEVKGTAASYDARQYDTATKIVVMQDELLKYGDSRMSDVVKRLPGVTATDGGIRMRGLGAGYTRILVNGEPAPPGFSLDLLNPAIVERVEIMRAATAEYSTQAIAGTINFVLKKSVQRSQKDTRVGLQNENGRLGPNVGFQTADKLGALNYAFTGAFNKTNRFSPALQSQLTSDNAGTVLMHRESTTTASFRDTNANLSARVTWNYDQDNTFVSQTFLTYFKNETQSLFATDVLAGGEPPLASSSSNSGFSTAVLRSDVSWTRKLQGGSKLDLRLGITQSRQSTDVASAGEDYRQEVALTSTIRNWNDERSWSSTGKYSVPFGDDHSFAAGWDVGQATRNESNFRFELSPTGLTPLNLDRTLNAKMLRAAIYLQDEWNLTPRWSVYGGVRWEALRTRAAASDYGGVANDSHVLSPLLQSLWKIPGSKRDQLRLAITRTYKAQTLSDLVPAAFIARENSSATPDYRGNPHLKPELAWGLDVSYERFFDGGGNFSFGGFARRMESVNFRHVRLIEERWVNLPENDGGARTFGLELDTKFPLKLVWPQAPSVDLRANVTKTWSRLSSIPGPYNRLDAQTPLSVNFGADYRVSQLPLTLGANVSCIQNGYARVSLVELRYTSPQTTVDAYALLSINPRHKLRIGVANWLHRTAYKESRFWEAPESTSVIRQASPSYTTVRLTLESKF